VIPSVTAVEASTAPIKSPSKLRDAAFLVMTMAIMAPFSVLLLLVAVITGFQARRLYSGVLVRSLSRFLLWLIRVRVEVRGEPLRGRQVFYMPNHPSTLDVFILTSLGLPNARYFMSRGVWVYLPFAFTAWLMGVFFTPPQSKTRARIRCFQRAERRLRSSGESILGSPEGRVSPTGLGRFNRGVFHLATNLGVPIVPIYIDFPPGHSPGGGFSPQPTTVQVHFLPPIETGTWSVAELEKNRSRVRGVFMDFAAALQEKHPKADTASRVIPVSQSRQATT